MDKDLEFYVFDENWKIINKNNDKVNIDFSPSVYDYSQTYCDNFQTFTTSNFVPNNVKVQHPIPPNPVLFDMYYDGPIPKFVID